ncbi:Fic family protein [Candidatus Parcubacteria bacterium]|nr:Fic family protein [Candidatus Parcubacteria bacterium]
MLDRKQKIINIVKKGDIGIKDLLLEVNKGAAKKASKITIIRDLDGLIKNSLIERIGRGPAIKYRIAAGYKLFEDIDEAEYFSSEPDKRSAKNVFNFEVFGLLEKNSVFNETEESFLNELNEKYQKNIASLPKEIIRKESERLMIELSWKSSKIEGNTYDLLETEFLIKENREASGHTKLEAQMILNHKDTLDFIQKEKIKKISLRTIQRVHKVLTQKMGILNSVRSKPVGITGTVYRPLSDMEKIKKALYGLCKLVNGKENIFEKSMLLNLLIAYVQPFNDGNKRTSRLLGNAVLMSRNYCPLSFRSIDELEYKKAVILFYERNNLRYFKELFIEQYKFAVENYFSSGM